MKLCRSSLYIGSTFANSRGLICLGVTCLASAFLCGMPAATSAKPQTHKPAVIRPLVTRFTLDVDLELNKGKVTLSTYRKVDLGKKTLLPRFKGNYTLQLFSLGELRDQIRFDFPLGAMSARAKASAPTNLRARTTVRVPQLDSITRMVVVGRDSKKVLEIPLTDGKSPHATLSIPPSGPTRTSAFGPRDAKPTPPKKTTNKKKKRKTRKR
jgi:hypothetical protein